MWVPREVADWFRISKDSVDALREELASVRSERDILKSQLLVAQNTVEWIRLRINALEVERSILIKKAYGHDVPVPEITRTIPHIDANQLPDLFADMGDDLAPQFGYPVYGKA